MYSDHRISESLIAIEEVLNNTLIDGWKLKIYQNVVLDSMLQWESFGLVKRLEEARMNSLQRRCLKEGHDEPSSI